MRALQGGQNSLAARQGIKARHGFVVATAGVLHAAGVFPITVLGTHARVIEPGGHRVHVARLAIFILHHVAEAAMQHPGAAVGQRRRVFAGVVAPPARFDADEFHFRMWHEWIEHPRRVAAAADAGDRHVREATDPLD